MRFESLNARDVLVLQMANVSVIPYSPVAEVTRELDSVAMRFGRLQSMSSKRETPAHLLSLLFFWMAFGKSESPLNPPESPLLAVDFFDEPIMFLARQLKQLHRKWQASTFLAVFHNVHYIWAWNAVGRGRKFCTRRWRGVHYFWLHELTTPFSVACSVAIETSSYLQLSNATKMDLFQMLISRICPARSMNKVSINRKLGN